MATAKKSAAKSGKKATAKKATPAKEPVKKVKAPGIGRSAITGRFMSVSSAKAHKKTAIVQGAGKKKGA